MKYTKDEIQKLLRNDIDYNAVLEDFNVNLSAFMAGSFELYSSNVLGTNLIFAEPSFDYVNIKTLIKRKKSLEVALDLIVVLILPSLSSNERRVLVFENASFVTLNGDYYIPQLAVSFASKIKQQIRSSKTFNATQQLVFLYCLYENSDKINQADIKRDLGLSSGGVSSALNILVQNKLIDYSIVGKTARKKEYFINDKSDYYSRGIKLFGDPVKEVVTVGKNALPGNLPMSGLSALATRSNLLPPDVDMLATNVLNISDEMKLDDDKLCKVQILRYNPIKLSQDGIVDPVTMLLTIDEDDERIRLAIQEAMKEYKWYKD